MFDHGITVNVVFDGDHLPLKRKKRSEDRHSTNESNKKRRHRIILSPQPRGEVDRISSETRFGKSKLTVIHAPYEADAQLAFLYLHKIVDVVVSEDYDLLAYGVKHLMSKIEMNTSSSTICGNLIEMRFLPFCKWDFSGWTEDMFLTFYILCGCDYVNRL